MFGTEVRRPGRRSIEEFIASIDVARDDTSLPAWPKAAKPVLPEAAAPVGLVGDAVGTDLDRSAAGTPVGTGPLHDRRETVCIPGADLAFATVPTPDAIGDTGRSVCELRVEAAFAPVDACAGLTLEAELEVLLPSSVGMDVDVLVGDRWLTTWIFDAPVGRAARHAYVPPTLCGDGRLSITMRAMVPSGFETSVGGGESCGLHLHALQMIGRAASKRDIVCERVLRRLRCGFPLTGRSNPTLRDLASFGWRCDDDGVLHGIGPCHVLDFGLPRTLAAIVLTFDTVTNAGGPGSWMAVLCGDVECASWRIEPGRHAYRRQVVVPPNLSSEARIEIEFLSIPAREGPVDNHLLAFELHGLSFELS